MMTMNTSTIPTGILGLMYVIVVCFGHGYILYHDSFRRCGGSTVQDSRCGRSGSVVFVSFPPTFPFRSGIGFGLCRGGRGCGGGRRHHHGSINRRGPLY